MKKNLAVAALFFITLGSTQVVAQTNKKASSKESETTTQELPIRSSSDSLSYSYGVNLANQGLKQYMEQMGISAGDTERMNLFIKGMRESISAREEEKAYFSGAGIGDQIGKMAAGLSTQAQVKDLNMQLIANGIEDILLNKTPQISNPDQVFQKKMEEANAKAEEVKKQEYAVQIEAGNKFLEENKTVDGVVSLPSGLQYKILTKGEGSIPGPTDQVKVHYRGTLLDGTEFDSSYKRGEPIVLGVSQVIPGWTEALQLMPVGSKWILYIPYNLAYGERGGGSAIPPYANLIFEIELLDIEK